MTQQLNFGDLVSCEGYPTAGVIVGLNDEINMATVCFYGLYHPERLMNIDSLTLIHTPTPSASTGWPTPQTKSAASCFPPSA